MTPTLESLHHLMMNDHRLMINVHVFSDSCTYTVEWVVTIPVILYQIWVQRMPPAWRNVA